MEKINEPSVKEVPDEKYKDAFDLIQQLCDGYQTTIKITYGVRKIISKRNRKWVVETMGQSFISDNPLEAIGQAFKVILAVNGRYDLLPNEQTEAQQPQ